MKQEILFVDNLKCGGCATTVEQRLLNIQGVSKVIVKVEEGVVEIYHDEQNNRVVFIKQLNDMGYPERGTSTLLHKGKSYFSCAVGKMNMKEKTNKK